MSTFVTTHTNLLILKPRGLSSPAVKGRIAARHLHDSSWFLDGSVMLLEHALFARAWEGETLFTKTFWTGEEGGEGKEAENSLGWLQRSAHGLFIWRISAGDLRAGLRDEADWETVNCESDRRMEFRGRRLRRDDAAVQTCWAPLHCLTPPSG